MPRKTAAQRNVVGRLGRRASMRPRPDAAENRRRASPTCWSRSRFNEAAARCRGKPPAHRRLPAGARAGFNEAAARCRGKPHQPALDGGVALPASMRPRPDAAENHGMRGTAQVAASGFNEAAARCRGKPAARPPGRAGSSRFNEAAARCRGKPRSAGDEWNLNDKASMRPRPDAAENRRRRSSPPLPDPLASMRPRPDAAENPWQAAHAKDLAAGLQ